MQHTRPVSLRCTDLLEAEASDPKPPSVSDAQGSAKYEGKNK